MRYTAIKATPNFEEACVYIDTTEVDDTELVFDDPEELARLNEYGILSDDELNESIIDEPNSKIIGDGYFIHARFIIHTTCEAFKQVFTGVDTQNEVSEIELSAKQQSFKYDRPKRSLYDETQKALKLETCDDLRVFISLILERSPF